MGRSRKYLKFLYYAAMALMSLNAVTRLPELSPLRLPIQIVTRGTWQRRAFARLTQCLGAVTCTNLKHGLTQIKFLAFVFRFISIEHDDTPRK
jgi:hypothetical protein